MENSFFKVLSTCPYITFTQCTALQPNIWFAFLIVMQVMILSFEGADLIYDAYLFVQVLVTASKTLSSQGLVTEEEAEKLTWNIISQMWRTYGEVYHAQEWLGLDNIPEGGALVVYYHGSPLPMDYCGLVAEMWLRRHRKVHSVVDRSLMQMPGIHNLRNQFKLTSGTVDSCAEVLA